MSKEKLEKELSKDPDVKMLEEDIDLDEPSCETSPDATGALPKVDWNLDTVNRLDKANYKSEKGKRPSELIVGFVFLLFILLLCVGGYFIFQKSVNDSIAYEDVKATFSEFEDSYKELSKKTIDDFKTIKEKVDYIYSLKNIESELSDLIKGDKLKSNEKDESKIISDNLKKIISISEETLKKSLQDSYDSIVVEHSLFDESGSVLEDSILKPSEDYLNLFDSLLEFVGDFTGAQDKISLYEYDAYIGIIDGVIDKVDKISKLCQEAMIRESLKQQEEILNTKSQKELDSVTKEYEAKIAELGEKISELSASLDERTKQLDSANDEIDNLKSEKK